MSNKELIEEARDMTLYARTTKHCAVSHADMIDDLADALEASLAARQPSEDDRLRVAEIRHRRAYSVYGEGTAYEDIGWLLDALSRAADLATQTQRRRRRTRARNNW